MTSRRRTHTATVLSDGKVLIAAGTTEPFTPRRSCTTRPVRGEEKDDPQPQQRRTRHRDDRNRPIALPSRRAIDDGEIVPRPDLIRLFPGQDSFRQPRRQLIPKPSEKRRLADPRARTPSPFPFRTFFRIECITCPEEDWNPACFKAPSRDTSAGIARFAFPMPFGHVPRNVKNVCNIFPA